MPQLSPEFAAHFRPGLLVGWLAAALLLGACGRAERNASTDSLLTRDLTLAASATRPTLPSTLGDTATTLSTPPAAVPSATVAAASPRAPTPRATAPRESRQQAPQQRPRPTAPVTPVPDPAPPTATVASAPLPASPASANTPPAGSSGEAAPATGTAAGSGAGRAIGTGTGLIGRTNASICSLANRPGDRLVATLSNDVVGPNGARLAAGTPILVEMSTPATPGDFAFRVKAVQVDGVLIPIDGTVQVEGETTERRVSKGGDQGKVIGGAIAGAILGRVLGGGAKGTVIGAAGGAAAGTIAASRNSVTEKCLPAGATLTVTLSAPLVLSPGTP